jgi:Protein of unknown function (DUF1553)/Protein of unknown function (DUF1549)/Planctomycete cytochrome C
MIVPEKSVRCLRVAAVMWCAATAGFLLAADRPVSFAYEIRPILSNACFKCHGPDSDGRKGGLKNSGGLRLDTEEGARMDLGGKSALVPGHPEQSDLIARIRSHDPDEVMPPAKSGKSLTPQEMDLLERWIREGGKFSRHWSYEPAVRPEPPQPGHPVDAFVRDRLLREGLPPQPEADRITLIRRLSFDLTGLPPLPEEVDRFVADTAPDAYEKLVDRLLAAPAYGEHWGRAWLDLARYADSAGYADDPPREIWGYRDYVIRSFNTNLPFDQFTIEQLAGDLLRAPTEAQLTATAFHRNTMTNSEGGTNDEEFRSAAIVDRVNTTMSVWMGTSMACAQCHTHKYDPITQTEYYQLYAFLNNTADNDQKNEAPLQTLESETARTQRLKLEADIAAAEQEFTGITPAQQTAANEWAAGPDGQGVKDSAKLPEALKRLLSKPAAERNAEDARNIAVAYVREIAPELAAPRARLAELSKALAAVPSHTVPVLKELPAGQRRKTFLHLRGNYLAHGDEVTEGGPEGIFPMPAGEVRNRLTLARWLVDAKNPLTSRVLANRYWEALFGMGIVRTSEEFGAQGELPSHPELLDWLATELVREKWDLKKFVKLIVTSATYRQASTVTPALAARDPDNRLLARGPRVRLSAEMVRDQALAASGLLSKTMFGPPVRPVRPAMGLSAAFGGGLDWQTSTGGDQHRRAIYTEWRRTSPYPSMTTFDAPNREICILRRDRSNTPLQALVLMNDPVYVETSQALARKATTPAATPEEVIRRIFRLVLSRLPSDRESKRLVTLQAELLAAYRLDPAKASAMATNPIGPLTAGVDAADLAAWTAVAGVVQNLDETLLKR